MKSPTQRMIAQRRLALVTERAALKTPVPPPIDDDTFASLLGEALVPWQGRAFDFVPHGKNGAGTYVARWPKAPEPDPDIDALAEMVAQLTTFGTDYSVVWLDVLGLHIEPITEDVWRGVA